MGHKKDAGKSNIKINHIFFLLDDSGSMNHLRKPTVDNFNETVQALKADATGDQANMVSLVKFGKGVTTVREPTALSEFEEISIEEYNPNAWTPLYDGLGYVIGQAKAAFEKYKNFDNAALIYVLTDGQENASKEFNREQISSMIKELQEEGRFTFTFMGCSDDLIHEARALGIYDGNTVKWDFNPEGLGQVTVLNNVATKSFFGARSAGMTACSGFYSHDGYMTAEG